MFDLIYKKLHLLESPEGFYWEFLSEKHTKSIIKWRNNEDNLKFFHSQEKINEEDQKRFLNNYHLKNRIDLVLIDKIEHVPVGVWNIKNITSKPESGRLIGELKYRGIGLGKKASYCLFNFWFHVLGNNVIFAETLKNNDTNIAINLKMGYSVVKEKLADGKCFLEMVLTKESFINKNI